MTHCARLWWTGILVAGATLGAPAPAGAQEAPALQELRSDRYPPPSVRWKLVFGGVATTAGFYALAQPFSYAWPDAPGARDLRVPVAGPWMAIANNSCRADEPDCSTLWRVVRGVFTALDGLGQAGGLAIALEGLFVPTMDVPAAPTAPGAPRQERRPPREPSEPPPEPPSNLFFGPAPIGVGGVGLGVVGSF